jgi:aminomethyltransferase
MITSGSFAPTLGCSVALARVPLAVLTNDGVEVQIREKWLPATVVKYPFVRRGKSLVSLPV